MASFSRPASVALPHSDSDDEDAGELHLSRRVTHMTLQDDSNPFFEESVKLSASAGARSRQRIHGHSTLQSWSLSFIDPVLEEAFVVYMVARSWTSRITCVVVFMVGLVVTTLVMPNAWPLINIMFFSACGICVVTGTALLFLKRSFESMRHNDRTRYTWRLLGVDRSHSKEDHVHSYNDMIATVVLRSSRMAHWGEVVSILCLLIVNNLYLAAVVLGRYLCWNETLAVRQRTCYATLYLEVVPVLVSFATVVASPIRVTGYGSTILVFLVVFVCANVVGPSIVFDANRFYASLAVVVSQLAVCMLWVYVREEDQRRTFLNLLLLEDGAARMLALQRRTRDAATGRMPIHIVDAVAKTGMFEANGTGIVFGVAMANFGRWVKNRGPCDLVHQLQKHASICDMVMDRLLHDDRWEVTRLEGFGEFAIFAVMPSPPLSPSLNNKEDYVNEWLKLSAATVSSTLIESLNAADVMFSLQERDALLCAPPSVLETKDTIRVHVLRPVAVATCGPIWLRFAPKLVSGVIGGGAAVLDVLDSLNEFQSQYQPTVRLHVSPEFLSRSSIDSTSSHCLKMDQEFTVISVNVAPQSLPNQKGSTSHRRDSSDRRGPQESLLSSKSKTSNSLEDSARQSRGAIDRRAEASLSQSQDRASNSRGRGHDSDTARAHSPDLMDEALVDRWYGFAYFRSDETEVSFHSYRQHHFSVNVVRANALSMILFSFAMFAVCGVYELWAWTVRASLPYACGALLTGVALLMCTYSEAISKQSGVLEVFYWLFTLFCLASSVMPPQFHSIFDASVLPWEVMAIMIVHQRPVWYGPVAMWLLQGVMCLFVVLCVLCRTRTFLWQFEYITAYISVLFLILFIALRRLLDNAARLQFLVVLELSRTRLRLRSEVRLLLDALEHMVPNHVARSMIKHASLRSDFELVHPARSTSFSTSVKDVAFALIRINIDPFLPAAAQLATMLTFSATLQRSVAAFGVEIAKSIGDLTMITGPGHSGTPLGVEASAVLRTVVSCRAALIGHPHLQQREDSPCELPVAMCAVVDACPTVGALLGRHFSTFEWYAPEIQRALTILRMGPSRGPLEWGVVACTERVCYHVRACREGPSTCSPGASDEIVLPNERHLWAIRGAVITDMNVVVV